MTILVAGATGLAGSAIKGEFEKKVEKVIGISSKDLNLLDRNATFKYMVGLVQIVISPLNFYQKIFKSKQI
jgi:GDP-L-fucose synthase